MITECEIKNQIDDLEDAIFAGKASNIDVKPLEAYKTALLWTLNELNLAHDIQPDHMTELFLKNIKAFNK